ncbi:mechanosensitive ion channel [Aquisalibacillus elongatus]|uniref:Putative transporter (Transmembrane protein) n=1 Tax=Aquisalibacillus elongatus TaxID=485577 RepID=A0A3N5CC19_9BACI|nr:mechanosensitive ion channel [Aquisalibacillus elongatus]RPF54441.1 putative transporter (transmembrane protein) [Aquisalibacillus elongatus]
MNDLATSFQNMLNDLIQAIPNVITALLLLLLAWIVAVVSKNIVQKLFVKIGLHKGLGKTPVVEDENQGKSILESLGKVIYFLVFILFLPAILDALNMRSVSEPISNMMDKLLGFIPNLIAASIILVIGIFIAKLIKDLFEKFFRSLNLDDWFNKVSPNNTGGDDVQTTLSTVLANIIYIIILIPVITMALEALEIRTISEPIQAVLNDVLTMIPNIFVAIVLLIVGYYLAKLLGNLLTNLLQGTGINNIYESFGLNNEDKPNVDLAQLLGTVVKTLIILFFTVEALNVLELEVLNTIGDALIGYLPFLVSALLILGGGLFLANLLSNWISKYTNSPFSAEIVKYVVIVFAVFMTLDQLQFAKTIVNIGFLLILGGLMIAFAISFGIGGREFAKTQLGKLENKLSKKNE